MIETTIKNLSVEEIMNKIKQEVQRRKEENAFVQEHQVAILQLRNDCELQFSDLNVVDISVEPFIQKDVYEYSDFSNYHDIEFIKNCYRGLLKREADSDGLKHYLNLLRSGAKNKSEIISMFHYSKEGRTKKVKLLGSKKRYVMAMLNSLAFFGYILKWFITLVTLPKLTKRLNQYENFTYQLYMKNIDNEFKLQNTLNENIQDSFTSLNAFVNTKANKTDLDSLYAELETKANKTDLDSLYAELETKANKTDLDSLYAELETKANKIELDIEHISIFKATDFLAKAFTLTKHSLQDKDLDKMYYSLFEDAFYESKIVKEKQKIYINYLNDTSKKSHLDLGCGRGEFLELLNENKIPSRGIDINQLEIRKLEDNNFNVELIDIDSFFQENNLYYSSISALQVFEHLNISQIKSTIHNMFKSLEVGGAVIIETVNPHSYFAFGGFYMDETHIRPIPPEQLTFIMQWYGFKEIEVIYSSKLPDEFMVSDMKRNYYDYALIGYKR